MRAESDMKNVLLFFSFFFLSCSYLLITKERVNEGRREGKKGEKERGSRVEK